MGLLSHLGSSVGKHWSNIDQYAEIYINTLSYWVIMLVFITWFSSDTPDKRRHRTWSPNLNIFFDCCSEICFSAVPRRDACVAGPTNAFYLQFQRETNNIILFIHSYYAFDIMLKSLERIVTKRLWTALHQIIRTNFISYSHLALKINLGVSILFYRIYNVYIYNRTPVYRNSCQMFIFVQIFLLNELLKCYSYRIQNLGCFAMHADKASNVVYNYTHFCLYM